MELNVNYIELSSLVEHPLQKEIYGETLIDDDFIENIRERGILQNLLITDGDLFGKQYKGKYVIIAGHRRALGSLHAGLESVPCIIKSYNNIDETTLDFLSSNKQRKKTKIQLFNESENYKILIEKIKLSRSNSNTYKSEKDVGLNLAPNEIDYDNPNVQRVLEMLNMGYRQNEILAECLEIDKNEIKKITAIYSGDYMQKFNDKWENLGAKQDKIFEIMKKWNDIRDEYTNDKISLHSAYTQIQDLIKDFESKFKSKDKKEKAEKPKPKQKIYVPYFKQMTEELQGQIIVKYEEDKYEIVTSKQEYFIENDAEDTIETLKDDTIELTNCDCIHLEFMSINEPIYIKLTEYFSLMSKLLNIKLLIG